MISKTRATDNKLFCELNQVHQHTSEMLSKFVDLILDVAAFEILISTFQNPRIFNFFHISQIKHISSNTPCINIDLYGLTNPGLERGTNSRDLLTLNLK